MRGAQVSNSQELAKWKMSACNLANGLAQCPCKRHRGARSGAETGVLGLALTCRCVLFNPQIILNLGKFHVQMWFGGFFVKWQTLAGAGLHSYTGEDPLELHGSCPFAKGCEGLFATVPTFPYYPLSCIYNVICLAFVGIWVWVFCPR